MKQNNQSSVAMSSTDKVISKKSLFDSIVDNEIRYLSEQEIQKYCTRVGIVFKALVSRDMEVHRLNFENELTNLVKHYCDIIDNELPKTE